MISFAEAVRLGAMITFEGPYFLSKSGACCAVGGALAALGAAWEPGCPIERARKMWLEASIEAKCPTCGCVRRLAEVVSHRHFLGYYRSHEHPRITRNELADWVELVVASASVEVEAMSAVGK